MLVFGSSWATSLSWIQEREQSWFPFSGIASSPATHPQKESFIWSINLSWSFEENIKLLQHWNKKNSYFIKGSSLPRHEIMNGKGLLSWGCSPVKEHVRRWKHGLIKNRKTEGNWRKTPFFFLWLRVTEVLGVLSLCASLLVTKYPLQYSPVQHSRLAFLILFTGELLYRFLLNLSTRIVKLSSWCLSVMLLYRQM